MMEPVTIMVGQVWDHSITLYNPHDNNLIINKTIKDTSGIHIKLPFAPANAKGAPPKEDPGNDWIIPPKTSKKVVKIEFSSVKEGTFNEALFLHTSHNTIMFPIRFQVVKRGFNFLESFLDFGVFTQSAVNPTFNSLFPTISCILACSLCECHCAKLWRPDCGRRRSLRISQYKESRKGNFERPKSSIRTKHCKSSRPALLNACKAAKSTLNFDHFPDILLIRLSRRAILTAKLSVRRILVALRLLKFSSMELFHRIWSRCQAAALTSSST